MGGDIAALRQEFMGRLGDFSKRDKASKNSPTFRQMTHLYRKRLNVVGATLMESGKTVKLKRVGNKTQGRGKPSESEYKLSRNTGIPCFNTVIVDEVSKAMPPELFLPVRWASGLFWWATINSCRRSSRIPFPARTALWKSGPRKPRCRRKN